MAKASFLKFRARVRFLRVREELSVWCREVGIRDDAVESLAWGVVAVIDRPPAELADLLQQQMTSWGGILNSYSATLLAERIRAAGTRGEVRFVR